VPSLLPRLQRAGFRKGLGQGNSTWLAVGVGAWGLRKVAQMAQRNTQVLLREELKPGQRIIIANGRATLEDAQDQGVPVTKPLAEVNEGRKSRKQRKAG